MRDVQKAPDDTRLEIDRNEFDGGSLCRCAGGLGSQVLFNAYKHVIEGGATPALFAESRIVFIPKSSDVDNNGRIVRSLEALRPLTWLQDSHGTP